MKLSQALGLPAIGQAADSAEIVVLHTEPELTPAALSAAANLTRGLDFHLILLAVHIVPYPLQLGRLSIMENHLSAQLRTLADASSLPVSPRIAFARDLGEALRQCVRPESLILIATRKRWWRTRAEKWAHELAGCGFRTALVHV